MSIHISSIISKIMMRNQVLFCACFSLPLIRNVFVFFLSLFTNTAWYLHGTWPNDYSILVPKVFITKMLTLIFKLNSSVSLAHCVSVSVSLCCPSILKIFPGNKDASGVAKNTLFPPLIGRFIRFHPSHWYNTATVRMELYGCELDGERISIWI